MKKCIVAGAVVMKKRKVLLHMHKKLGKWLYFGGHVDEGESPLEAAIRETKEESGLNVRIISSRKGSSIKDNLTVEQPLPLVIMDEDVRYKNGRHRHFDLVYLAEPRGKADHIAAGESRRFRWFAENEMDGLNTFGNVKSVLRYAFEVVNGK